MLLEPRFVWQPPSWETNPLNFAHGEQLFHLGAFVMLASGAATLASTVVTTAKITPDTLALISVGTGVWAGLRLLTALYQRQTHNRN